MTARLHRDRCPSILAMRLGATGIRCGRSCMWLRHGLIVGMALWLATATAKAEVSELKITKPPGLLFAPMLLMEHDKLVEKHAARRAFPGSRPRGSQS